MIQQLILAVAYLRMSSDDQSLSIEQQEREVREFAARNGYHIIRWYIDEGISASKGDEQRLRYQQLLIDSDAKDFQAVLCWSTSRFTRNHPQEAAEGKRILRKNGIYLDTVKEGRIDWNTFEGMMKDTLFNLLDHKYSIDLGRDSLRGRRNTFLAGGYPYGTIPYGYQHLYICGTERRTARRNEKTKNLRGWIHSLAVVDAEAEVVRRIFRLFVEEDKSLNAIAHILNRDGIAGPGRGVDSVWTTQNVRQRLMTLAYIAVTYIGKPRQRNRIAHNRIDPEEQPGNWPAIVERDVWDRAQEKLQGNKGHAHEGKSGALQGILRCGCCAQVLHKENPRKAEDPRGDKYRCNSTGRGLPVPCHRWTVFESEILPAVVSELVQAVDGETLALLEAKPETAGKNGNTEALRGHLRRLEDNISQAAGTFLEASTSPAMKKALEAKVENLTEEAGDIRHRIETLHALENQGGIQRFIDWWQSVRPGLIGLANDGYRAVDKDKLIVILEEAGLGYANSEPEVIMPDGVAILADPGKLRALLKRLNVEVRVHWRLVTDDERQARKKGRGPGRLPEWVIDTARLSVEIDCGSSDCRNAWGGCRDTLARGHSRRPSSLGRGGSP